MVLPGATITSMGIYGENLILDGYAVPRQRPLEEVTTELTAMLGDTDPGRRDGMAYTTLAGWVSSGAYDELLEGLGNEMATGLGVGLGESGSDTVFRRSFSARALTECLLRDNEQHVVGENAILQWGDRLASWFLREEDLRGFVPGQGWAHAVAYGADAIGALAGSAAIGQLELTVLLDVLAERLIAPTEHRFVHGEADRMALATMTILRRDLVDVDALAPWVARLAGHTPTTDEGAHADASSANAQCYLRSLHMQLALTPKPPSCRSDLLLLVIDQLRKVNPNVLSG